MNSSAQHSDKDCHNSQKKRGLRQWREIKLEFPVRKGRGIIWVGKTLSDSNRILHSSGVNIDSNGFSLSFGIGSRLTRCHIHLYYAGGRFASNQSLARTCSEWIPWLSD